MDYQAVLRKEYQEAGQTPLHIKINEQRLTIPYFYTIDAANNQQVGKEFLHDFLDVNQRLANQYKEQGQVPREVICGGLKYVVPYAYKDKKLSNEQAANIVFEKCLAKYHSAISMTAELNKMNPQEEHIVNIGYANYRRTKQKYEQILGVRVPNKQEKAVRKADEFMRKNPKPATNNKVGGGASNFKRAVKNFLIVSAAVGASYLAYNQLRIDERMTALRTQIAPSDPTDMRISFAEFAAGKYADKHGNIGRLDSAYNDLCVMLATVEGFHEKAFDDGLGNMTIGYGTTFYIDEQGKDAGKVQRGDNITKEEAFLQKQRYIANYMIPCLMQVDRPLSQREIIGFVATGFCIGQNELKSSQFLKLLSDNDKDAWRSLSIYGKQAGVRKRTALTSAYAQGLVSTAELMNFGWQNGENIYRCKIPELYACPEGSDIPYKDDKKFCRTIYYSKVQEHIQATIAQGVKNPVRNILPDSVVFGLEKAAKTIEFSSAKKSKGR